MSVPDGSEYSLDYRKLAEFVKKAVNSYKVRKDFTKEAFEIQAQSAFTDCVAANNSDITKAVRPVLHNRIDGLYTKFMAANEDFEEEVKPFVLTERVTATVKNIDDINFDEFTQNVSTTI